MPFGTLTLNNRLGVANLSVKNGAGFVTAVLKMPSDTAIYQQQLVHGTVDTQGPHAAADWNCHPPDSDVYHNVTFREVSAHDFAHGQRNISYQAVNPYYPAYPAYWQVGHRQTSTNQLYYLCNEPEAYVRLTDQDWCVASYLPRDRRLDLSIQACFPQTGYDGAEGNVNNSFWETENPAAQPLKRRIKADALAYVFLKAKSETEGEAGRYHLVLPPALINIGGLTVAAERVYWEIFFDCVLSNRPMPCGGYSSIAVANLRALHAHRYPDPPEQHPEFGPVAYVKGDIEQIRGGTDWFRSKYCSNGTLPLDVVLSEMGPNWTLAMQVPDPRGRSTVWTGGWQTFKRGLSWWNTYLSWLTRRAPTECQFASGKALYAFTHSASHPPYVCDMAEVPSFRGYVEADPQPRSYINFDNFQLGSFFNSPSLRPTSDVVSEGRYQDRFSVIRETSYGGRSWLIAPFGVCRATWAQIANDANNTAFGLGWHSSSVAGVVGTTSVSLQSGWNTIYFAVMKTPNQALAANTTFNFHWSSGSLSRAHGYMNMDEFDPPYAWIYTHPVTQQQSTEYVRSSMIFPVLCYTSQARTVTLQVQRNYAGGSLWLGRPIALPVACTWFNNQ